MKVTLKENGNPNQPRMCDLEEGEIAIILPNVIEESYVGRIVVMIGNDRAWTLGETAGESFSQISANTLPVRKLTAGEIIELSE